MHACTLESSRTRVPRWKTDLLLDWWESKKASVRWRINTASVEGKETSALRFKMVSVGSSPFSQISRDVVLIYVFCFMPAIPEKVEMFKNAGGLCGDRRMFAHIHPCVRADVCVHGCVGELGAGAFFSSFFSPHKTWDRPIKSHRWCEILQSPIIKNFRLVRWVDFLVNLMQLVMHISFLFFCWPSTSAQNESLSVWLCFLGAKQVGSCDECREMVSMQQLGLECSFNSLFFTSTHAAYSGNYSLCKYQANEAKKPVIPGKWLCWGAAIMILNVNRVKVGPEQVKML